MSTKKVLLFIYCLCFMGQSGVAQANEETKIKEVIITFFEGLHAGDTLKIKETTAENIMMQTIDKIDNRAPVLQFENFSKFLKNIASINPKINKIEEKIRSYDIKVDGAMANVWTPYKFYVNAEFSHCGVNSFQLFKDEEIWKIIYIIDTRRKQNCN